MRRSILFAGLLGLVLAFPAMAQAQIVAKINLSTQRMDVYVDGSPRYRWPVSTARRRLPYADRHLQADRAGALSPLDDL